jgi:hypothetical protein
VVSTPYRCKSRFVIELEEWQIVVARANNHAGHHQRDVRSSPLPIQEIRTDWIEAKDAAIILDRDGGSESRRNVIQIKGAHSTAIYETTAAVTGAYQFLLGKFAFPMFGNFFRTELATSAETSAGVQRHRNAHR